MRVTVADWNGQIYNFNVSSKIKVDELRSMCAREMHVSSKDLVISYNGTPLNEMNRTLDECHIKNNDVLSVQRASAGTQPFPSIDFSSFRIPGLNTLRNNFLRYLNGGTHQSFTSDYYAPEVQKRIEESIRIQNVESNMEMALEHFPEAFGNVVMLFVKCKVNGHPIKAFVDSGAQMTIISKECAERCGLMRLVDRRFAGVAKGVGVQAIIGRIHLAQIEIGGAFLTTSFSVLDQPKMDILLGLDILRRHQCIIDLKQNKLIIGSAEGLGISTPFLPESELPEYARNTELYDEEQRIADAIRRSAEEAGRRRRFFPHHKHHK